MKRGQLPTRLRAAFDAALHGLVVDDTAAAALLAVKHRLLAHDFRILSEVEVPDRGGGRGGRVDLLAYHYGGLIAVEIDRRTPRRKSIVKLGQIADATLRLIVLRGAALAVCRVTPPGIDGLVRLPVWTYQDHPRRR